MTEEDKLFLAQPLTDIYIAMETDLMMAIAEQLARDGEISPSSEWRLRKLAESGALTKTAMKIIASYTGIQSDMLAEAVEIAALEVINDLEPAFAKMAADGLFRLLLRCLLRLRLGALYRISGGRRRLI